MQQHPIDLEVVTDVESNLCLRIEKSLASLWKLKPGDRLRVDPNTIDVIRPAPPSAGGADGRRNRGLGVLRTRVTKAGMDYHYVSVPMAKHGMFPADGQLFELTDGTQVWDRRSLKSWKISSMAPIFTKLGVNAEDTVEITPEVPWERYRIRKV